MTDTSPTVLRRRLGADLRKLREQASVSLADAAKHLEMDRTNLGRIEAGKNSLKVRDLRALFALYGVDAPAVTEELEALLAESGRKGWWEGHAGKIRKTYDTYIGLEAGAIEIMNYETMTVPGLLQTREYATALTAATVPEMPADEVDARVEVRMRRQARVQAGELRVTAVVDESILHRKIGGEQVWRDQLEYLATFRAPHHVQILPFDTPAHPGALGAFVILRFPEDPASAYVENVSGDLFLDGDAARHYASIFTALQVAALPAEMSRRRILAAIGKGERP